MKKRHVLLPAVSGYPVDQDGVIDFPERIAVMRSIVKSEVIETRLEWYSAHEGKIRVRMTRTVVKRLAPVPARHWPKRQDKNLSLKFAALEKRLSGSQSRAP